MPRPDRYNGLADLDFGVRYARTIFFFGGCRDELASAQQNGRDNSQS
jgi:hypothetical protein